MPSSSRILGEREERLFGSSLCSVPGFHPQGASAAGTEAPQTEEEEEGEEENKKQRLTLKTSFILIKLPEPE